MHQSYKRTTRANTGPAVYHSEIFYAFFGLSRQPRLPRAYHHLPKQPNKSTRVNSMSNHGTPRKTRATNNQFSILRLCLFTRPNSKSSRRFTMLNRHTTNGPMTFQIRGIRRHLVHRQVTLILLISALLRCILSFVAQRLLTTLNLRHLQRRQLRRSSTRLNLRMLTIRRTQSHQGIRSHTINSILRSRQPRFQFITILRMLLLMIRGNLRHTRRHIIPLLSNQGRPFNQISLILRRLGHLLILLTSHTIKTSRLTSRIRVTTIRTSFKGIMQVRQRLRPPILVVRSGVKGSVKHHINTTLNVRITKLKQRPPSLNSHFTRVLLQRLRTQRRFLMVLLSRLFRVINRGLTNRPPKTTISQGLHRLRRRTLPRITNTSANQLRFIRSSRRTLRLLNQDLSSRHRNSIINGKFRVTTRMAILISTPSRVNNRARIALQGITRARLFRRVFKRQATFNRRGQALFIIFQVIICTTFVKEHVIFTRVLIRKSLLQLLLLFKHVFLFLRRSIILGLLFSALFRLRNKRLRRLSRLGLLQERLLLGQWCLFLVGDRAFSGLEVIHSRFNFFFQLMGGQPRPKGSCKGTLVSEPTPRDPGGGFIQIQRRRT